MPKTDNDLTSEYLLPFIDTFVLRERRARYKYLLTIPEGRNEVLGKLHHWHDYDSRWVVCEKGLKNPAQVAEALYERDAPKLCYCLSTLDAVDGREMPLEEALMIVLGTTVGTVLICRPRHLAYHEGEGHRERLILAK